MHGWGRKERRLGVAWLLGVLSSTHKTKFGSQNYSVSTPGINPSIQVVDEGVLKFKDILGYAMTLRLPQTTLSRNWFKSDLRSSPPPSPALGLQDFWGDGQGQSPQSECRISLCSPRLPKLAVLLPQPPQSCDQKHVPPQWAFPLSWSVNIPGAQSRA